jgi:segregation and condensation protein B
MGALAACETPACAGILWQGLVLLKVETKTMIADPDNPTPEEIDAADDAPDEQPAATKPPRKGLEASDAEVAATVEAMLFASDAPLPASRIASVAELPASRVKKAIASLNERYGEIGSSFRIEEIAGGYQMLTLPEYNDVLGQLFAARKDSRLSQPAMETLAIIAYRQPILRADIEAIRGVACGEVLRGLLEKNLIKIVGRAEVIGRPMLYGTTKTFLEVFGLASLDDLPRVEELRTPEEQQADQDDDAQQDEELPFDEKPQESEDVDEFDDDEDWGEDDDWDDDEEEEEEEEL